MTLLSWENDSYFYSKSKNNFQIKLHSACLPEKDILLRGRDFLVCSKRTHTFDAKNEIHFEIKLISVYNLVISCGTVLTKANECTKMILSAGSALLYMVWLGYIGLMCLS